MFFPLYSSSRLTLVICYQSSLDILDGFFEFETLTNVSFEALIVDDFPLFLGEYLFSNS